MTERKLKLLSLSLILQQQWRASLGAGLRGPGLSLIDDESSPGGTLFVQPSKAVPPLLDEENPPLLCPHTRLEDSHCPSSGVNQTTPVCQYNPKTQEYATLCLKRLSDTAVLPNSHPKSYCGACRACFHDKDELQAAVDQYKSYRQVDVDLAEKYGWPIGTWCVDKITTFSNLFFRKSKFNEDISGWETSQVTDMTSMFQNAYAFNQPLDKWDTSRVTAMTRMFAMAIHFNQDISGWDVSNVNDMGYMFLHAIEFDQDISGWQVHNAYTLNSMFFGATKFNQDSLKKWEISDHADTENMCEWTQQPEETKQES